MRGKKREKGERRKTKYGRERNVIYLTSPLSRDMTLGLCEEPNAYT